MAYKMKIHINHSLTTIHDLTKKALIGIFAVPSPIFGFVKRIIYAISSISANITERKRIEEIRTRLSAIVEVTTDIVVTTNVDGRMLYINKAGQKMLGIYENEDISHVYIFRYYPTWVNDLVIKVGIPTAIREGAWTGETAFLSYDGREIPFSQVIIAHKDQDGSVRYLSAIARDITERKRFESQIVYMANRDPLTDLFNRRRFLEELESQIAQGRRFGTKGAVLFLDVDNFKYVNDSLGHQSGDNVLITLARLLKKRSRETDVVARLGGDEFAIILSHVDENKVKFIANKIQKLIQQEFLGKEGYFNITVSIGIALFPEHSDTGEELLTYADLAMYKAKEEGRNCVCIYTPEQKTQIESHINWEKCIRDALKQNRFILHAQPIFDLHQKCIAGHEVLLRMADNNGKLIYPSQFLYIAEQFGLIHDIDRWVAREAIRLIEKLKRNDKTSYLAVNLSGKSFIDAELLSLIEKELQVTDVDPVSLVFEITETSTIENMNAAQNFIAALKSMGCRFALDDFGIGFSSFNYLKQLPVDYIKIDGSFVHNLPIDPVDQHLVKAMVEVACGLGKKTIAEFVENEKTLHILQKLGVDYAQGYYIGRPCEVSEL